MTSVHIHSVNTSAETGTIKHAVPSIRLTPLGVEGDAHAGEWHRQVSLLGTESIRSFERQAKRPIRYGEFAENITTEGIELWKMMPLDILKNDNVELEVTQIGKTCHGSSCAIFREVGNCVMPKEGIFARVLRPGIVVPGETLNYHPRIFSVRIITLSDRAAKGVYTDKSGPRTGELLQAFFDDRRPPSGESRLNTRIDCIPDDPELLRKILTDAVGEETDFVFTTGGTGIGPRDITPDVVKPMLTKEIPGIMEMIRMKYGQEKPQALTSRSVAGVIGKSLVFTLPGSVNAVNEYMPEILKSLMHLTYMLHSLEMHGH